MPETTYMLTTRLSEPTHIEHSGFSDPIWAEFRKDPQNWIDVAKSSSVNYPARYSWRPGGKTHLTGGEKSACVAITTKDVVIIEEVVSKLLEEWPEVYVLDGPSYAVYSKLLMYAVGDKMTLDKWSHRHHGFHKKSDFFTEDFHLANFFDPSPDLLEVQLEKRAKYSNLLEYLREDGFTEFTLLSPFLPESLMLNFYSQMSSSLQLYYKLDEQVLSVNLVEEFADNCDKLASLYMSGCLSCTHNHDCIPTLTGNQVEYGFRLSTKQVDKTLRNIANTGYLQYAPMASHERFRERAHKLLNYSYLSGGGIPRSTDQLLLIRNHDPFNEENTLAKGIEAYLESRLRRAAAKKFREEQCSNCLLEPSCSSLQINKSFSHSKADISKSCKGAITKQDPGIDATLLEIATKLYLFVSLTPTEIASDFTKYIFNKFNSIELTPSVKKTMGILEANRRFFYGAIILPTDMVEYMEYYMDSKACDTIFHDWGRSLNRGKFVLDGTSRIHTGVAGLEKFSNEKSSKWSVLLPTHSHMDYDPVAEFRGSDVPWYISITSEEFLFTYGDLASTRVVSSSWSKDVYTRILYLVQAFTEITIPKSIVTSGSFGNSRSVMPMPNYHIHIPSNKYLRKISKATNTTDTLTDYINGFIWFTNAVAWPRAVVINAFSINKD